MPASITFLYVIVCPGGGIVRSVSSPFIECWTGHTMPVKITKFSTREAAEAAIRIARSDPAVGGVVRGFVVVPVAVPHMDTDEFYSQLARHWNEKPLPHPDAARVTKEQYEAIQRMQKTKRRRMRHHNN